MIVNDIFPDKKTFLRLSKKYNVIPVMHEILADLETPVSCFLKVGDRPYSYLLESVEGGEKLARYTFIGASPSWVFQSKGREISVEAPGKSKKKFTTTSDPLTELQNVLKRYRQAPVGELPPFCGGAVGYLGYDAVRFFEKIPGKNPDVQKIPEALFIFTDILFVFDHIQRKLKIVCNVFLDGETPPEKAYDQALEKIAREIQRLKSVQVEYKLLPPSHSGRSAQKIQSNFTRAAFRNAVLKAKRYIKAGDIFQVVLSQAFQTPLTARPFDVYRALRSVNPSPYMFYLNGGDFQLIGSSPEVHVRCEEGNATLRPIAGTRGRALNYEEDQRLEKELLNDKKERAEHLMLVDLGRNDLGRVCEYNSVQVPEFMVIERYSHVMHIVSSVQGRLKKNKNAFDLLRATFPAGTVSGAPKVRAMEIIDELENQKRGFYAGIVGYFSFSGNLDSCIAIRSILVKNKTALVQAGAGIVADSDPDKEYLETVNKAKALMKALQIAEEEVRSKA